LVLLLKNESHNPLMKSNLWLRKQRTMTSKRSIQHGFFGDS